MELLSKLNDPITATVSATTAWATREAADQPPPLGVDRKLKYLLDTFQGLITDTRSAEDVV